MFGTESVLDPMLDTNWGTTCILLPLMTTDGKMRATISWLKNE